MSDCALLLKSPLSECENIVADDEINITSLESNNEQHLLQSSIDENDPFFDISKGSASKGNDNPSVCLTWHNVSAYVIDEHVNSSKNCCDLENGREKESSKKDVLTNLFGYANPGEITAILGSSGSGKTTLLNVLAQRNLGALKTEGKVKVNGFTVDRDYMRKISAYVQQDDLFIGSFTVEEHLRFMAMLRMGKRYSIKKQHKRVNEVIRDLGLTSVANSLIGTRTIKGLSGGEKKRLSFASEILTSPPVLFCDELTSGLDAFLALKVISMLRDLVRKKRMTIVVTIHQPSSQLFEIFDKVYYMAEGRVVYCGTQADAVSIWNDVFTLPVPLNFNPSDHYIKTLSVFQGNTEKQKKEINLLCDKFLCSKLGIVAWELSRGEGDMNFPIERSQRIMKEKGTQSRYMSSCWQQMRMLCWRNLMGTLREPMLLKVQIFHSIIVAVISGIIFLNAPISQSTIMTVNGALLQSLMSVAFMFQFSVVHHFFAEIPVFLREHQNGLYSVSTFFLSKNLIELPTFVFLATLFSSIFYWMAPLFPSFEAFSIFILVNVLVQSCAISIGYFFSCACEKLPVAMALLPIFAVPMTAVTGFFINQDSIPWFFYPYKYLSWFSYGYEALMINQWTKVDEIPGCFSNATVTTPSPCLFPTGSDVLSSASFPPLNLWRDCLCLTSLVLGIRLFAFIALYVRARKLK